MKNIILILSLIFFTKNYSQEKNFIDKSYLETQAVVDTLVVPDLIHISISLKEENTKGKISIEELENKMNEHLTLIGIDLKKQLTLIDIGSNFKKYFLKDTDILKNKTFNLIVYDASTAGKVIKELEQIGISNVDLSKTELSNIENLKIKLKQKAINKAIKQAKAMLEPLNQNLGNAIYISDINSDLSTALQGRVAGVSIRGYNSIFKSNESENIEIEFKKIKIESTVNIKFEIE
ncbi:SIMPL domain-containing protein [Wenyingzhuangia sp. IMCC45467]